MHHSDNKSLIEVYLEKIGQAGIQKKYQVDIYVGRREDAPAPNEAHFILEGEGVWTVEDWSRGELQNSSSFLKLSDALDYSYKMLGDTPEFRRVARRQGYNPPQYEFAELVEALSIALRESGVRFSLQKSTGEMIASKGDLIVKLTYSEETRTASATVYEMDQLNSRFDHMPNALSYFYWRFGRNDLMA